MFVLKFKLWHNAPKVVRLLFGCFRIRSVDYFQRLFESGITSICTFVRFASSSLCLSIMPPKKRTRLTQPKVTSRETPEETESRRTRQREHKKNWQERRNSADSSSSRSSARSPPRNAVEVVVPSTSQGRNSAQSLGDFVVPMTGSSRARSGLSATESGLRRSLRNRTPETHSIPAGRMQTQPPVEPAATLSLPAPTLQASSTPQNVEQGIRPPQPIDVDALIIEFGILSPDDEVGDPLPVDITEAANVNDEPNLLATGDDGIQDIPLPVVEVIPDQDVLVNVNDEPNLLATGDDVIQDIPLPVVEVIPDQDVLVRPIAMGFNYNPEEDYSRLSAVGNRIIECRFCCALRWSLESSNICCAGGKIRLADIDEAPEPLKSLISGEHPQSAQFLSHTRSYNSAFTMTSFGATQIGANDPQMLTFKVQGQVYHQIGSLLPVAHREARFLQIYFMGDDQAQADLRARNFHVDAQLLPAIQQMLMRLNPYILSFKYALEITPNNNDNYRLVIHADRRPAQAHPGRYNAPLYDEVAVIMLGEEHGPRDVVLRFRDNSLSRVTETHRSYDALQYPIIFSRGEDGYNLSIPQFDPILGVVNHRKTVSAMQFYCYRLMFRARSPNTIHWFRNLTNQYWVDMYAKIESERLNFIRNNQRRLRAEDYVHLRDEINQGADPTELGQMVILPSSFTGGNRYMHERTQDAFCYIREYGRPHLFITITCNPGWEEISSHLLPGQRFKDRHDVVARVFNLKLKKLMDLLIQFNLFGRVLCYMYTVEWQKRGLPHSHLLVWLESPIRQEHIDHIISAELPDANADPELFYIVKSQMIHGPCGAINPNSVCMLNGRCAKKYPRRFLPETVTSENGYPLYRRREPGLGGSSTEIQVRGEPFILDNRWVVPYSPVLLRIFKCHINVEIVHQINSIKYVCKYVNKGSDQACVEIQNRNDEVLMYQSGRYISTSEAAWRILAFPIHKRHPPVVHLAVHLENGQRVYFREDDAEIRHRLENPRATTLMAFFSLCAEDNFARTLLYCDVPKYFTFNARRNVFERRVRGTPVQGFPDIRRAHVIGRVYTIHPRNAECYYLRMLLHRVRGPTSFLELRTIDGIVHPSYQAACRALGLLVDDSHWIDTIEDACISDRPSKLRHLFAVILVFGNPSNARILWDRFRNNFSEDGLRRFLRQHPEADDNIDRSGIYNECLHKIQCIVYAIGGQELSIYGLPAVDPIAESFVTGDVFETDFTFDPMQLAQFVADNIERLNDEQTNVYRQVIDSLNSQRPSLFFLDAPGGTGKTFLLNLILATVRAEGRVAIAVASSGIAATLLPGGRTAHSTFKIPLNLETNDTPVCNIRRSDATGRAIRDCALIVWDECTMANRKAIDAIDRTLRDIRNVDLPMGGICFLFAGDFRQTLPVVVQGTRADQVLATVRQSLIWPMVRELTLSINVRVLLGDADLIQRQFADNLIRIGEGVMATTESDCILLSEDICQIVESVDMLIDRVYGDIRLLNEQTDVFLTERAILCPTNILAQMINASILNELPVEEIVYTSVNTLIDQDNAVQFPIEFLDSIALPGFPMHEIRLKVGVPIMLLRNLNAPKLCNGTRLRVRALQRNIIDAVVLTGCAAGESVFIPRIPLISSNYPIEFKRLQFPVSVCYAMTINKSQGQTMRIAGVDLRNSVFSHGQLYVALSRVSDPRNLYVYCPGRNTRNIVYRECIRN